MDKVQAILTAVAAALGFLSSVVIPLCIKMWAKFKRARAELTQSETDKFAAQIAEEQAAKMLEMTAAANEIIEELENSFATQNKILKAAAPDQSLGAVKKECALARLSEKAFNIGMDFDRNYWSQQIDKIVEMTRNVNARTAA